MPRPHQVDRLERCALNVTKLLGQRQEVREDRGVYEATAGHGARTQSRNLTHTHVCV